MLADHSTASHELTMDEVADAEAFYRIDAADREHQRNLKLLSGRVRRQEIIASAKRLTAEAVEHASGPIPTMTEARELERSTSPVPPSAPIQESGHLPIDGYDETYLDTMRQILEGMDHAEGHDE